VSQPGPALLDLYDRALPQVYGYLVSRCGSSAVAEDLTAETFLAAVSAVKRDAVPNLTAAWLVGVARHKLVDHWRRQGREERKLALVGQQVDYIDDPWDAHLDVALARSVLDGLGAHHRCALTLRYLDGLPVADVAREMDRTLHATEALLVRARSAFRAAYEAEGSDGAS
jgi:RNA polymerase sigma-70 factor, ECF subfamily